MVSHCLPPHGWRFILKSYDSKLRICSKQYYCLAVFMTLNQLGIATSIVNSAFIIILGAAAAAFAIAFGLGGREFAGNVLHKLENKEAKEDAPAEVTED